MRKKTALFALLPPHQKNPPVKIRLSGVKPRNINPKIMSTNLWSGGLLLIIGCSPPTIDIAKPAPPPPPPAPQFGSLFIEAAPPATNIYIDSLHIDGATPITVTLMAKEHTIELQRNFYQNFKTAVNILPDERQSITIHFTSSLYAYTGDWHDPAPNILPSGENVSMALQLYVEDNNLFGQDSIIINDGGHGAGACAGTIDPATNNAEMLCYYKSEVDDYWRSARYSLMPLTEFKISAKTVYVDSYNRLFLNAEMMRKN